MSQRESYIRKDWVLLTEELEPGVIGWTSPSNIAIVKYWGKHGNQLPSNPSLSFTLDRAHTDMKLYYGPRRASEGELELEFLFEGNQRPEFEKRIRKFLLSIEDLYPFLRQLHLKITSSNSFPHSSGIASSASSMSALALCLSSLEDLLYDTLEGDEEYRRKASFLARLASGSASRSIYERAALWGKTPAVEGSSDEYAIPVSGMLHKNFENYRDAILIVSSAQKPVSSSAGHEMMRDHPFAEPRFAQARMRIRELVHALTTGDLESFMALAEKEALALHGLMMSSSNSYMLFEPNTIHILQLIRNFRKETGVPICFTLDAGPNVHVLYPESHAQKAEAFIGEQLLEYCENGNWISDNMGEGPVQTN